MRVAKSNQLRRLLQIQDVALSVLVMAVCIDVGWYFGESSASATLNKYQLLVFVAAFSAMSAVAYAPRLHRMSAFDFFFSAVRFSGLVAIGLLLVITLGGLSWVDEGLAVSFFFALTVLLLLNRLFLRWWYLEGRREHRANYLKVIVIGSGDRARRLIDAYRQSVDWSIDVIACVEPGERTDRRNASASLPDNVDIIYGVDDFDRLLASEVVDEVVVCLPRRMLGDIEPVFAACEEQGICLKFMADLCDADTKRFSFEYVGDVPMLNVEPVLVGTGQLVAKRLVDLSVTVILLALLWPVFVLVAVAVRLESPGPVIFVQRRVGLNKRPFSMYKFRSMRQDAESLQSEVEHLNEANGPIFKISEDPRLTRIGGFLRQYSLDELPQLFNIALGHMSLVGPRPMSERDVERFDKGIQQRRFSVRPGLACLREVEGRSKLNFDRWLELDLLYIDTWSFGLDMKILLRLIPVVFGGKGAV